MLSNPSDLQSDLPALEEIEKATLRLVTQAVVEFRDTAQEIYQQEGDLVADIGEDITRVLKMMHDHDQEHIQHLESLTAKYKTKRMLDNEVF